MRGKCPSLFENVVSGCLKSNFQLDQWVNILILILLYVHVCDFVWKISELFNLLECAIGFGSVPLLAWMLANSC